MDLRQLRSFVAVAETLNFRRAAEQVFITQPSLSRQIQHLEASLGAQLFERSRRNVRLTREGMILFEEAHQLLEKADQLKEKIGRATRGEIGLLALGFVGADMFGIVPPLLRAFRSKQPDVKIVLHEMQTHEQLEALNEGRIDVGFCGARSPDETIAALSVGHEEVLIALPANHPFAGQAEVALPALAQEPFLMFRRIYEPTLFDHLIGVCQRAGFSPTIVQETDGVFNLLGLVASGLGVAFTPGSLATALRPEDVVFKPIRGGVLRFTLRMLWRADARQPTLRSFLEMVKQELPTSWKADSSTNDQSTRQH